MKKQIFTAIIAVILFPTAGFCQFHIGSNDLQPHKRFSKNFNHQIDSFKNEIYKIITQQNFDSFKNETSGRKAEFESDNENPLSEKRERLEDIVDSLKQNNDSSSKMSVYLFGQGSLSNIENLTTPNANISIGAAIQLGRLTTYCSYNAKPAASNDSAVLYKTFLFPEINSRAFILGFDYALNKDAKVRAHLLANFSISSLDSGGQYLITPYNFLVGGSLQLYGDLTGDTASQIKKLNHISINFIPYFSLTTIDPKDYNNYDSLFAKSYETANLTPYAKAHLPANSMPTTINSIGGKVELEIGSLCMFIDMKYVINSNTYLKYTNFNAFNWTIGAHIYTSLLSYTSSK